MGPRELILTTVVPGLIVGVALLIAWTIHARKKTDKPGPLWVTPIALSMGFAVAFWAVSPPTRWWPNTGSERFLQIAALAMLAGLGCALVRKPKFAWCLISAISLAATVWITLESLPTQSLTRVALFVWVALIAIGGTAALATMNAAANKAPAWLPPVQFIAIGLATSAISMFSYIALFAGLAGCVVAMATAAAVVSFIRKDFAMAPVGTLVLYMFLAALVVGSSQYAQDPSHLSAYVIVLCAPFGSLAAKIPLKRPGLILNPSVLSLMGVLAPLVAAVIIGFLTRVVPEPYDY